MTVTLPKDRELARLLRTCGHRYERLVSGLAIAADPDSGGSNVVTLPSTPQAAGRQSDADGVADALEELLRAARAAADPAAGALAAVCAKFGIAE